MADPSSTDLHPSHGGRFVLTRTSETPLTYRVEVYLPEARTVTSTLGIDANGTATLDPEPDDAWVLGETLKLARVVKRSRGARLTRWRGP